MLNDSAVSAQVVLTREKHRHRADITLHARGEKFLHGVGEAGSWEASLVGRDRQDRPAGAEGEGQVAGAEARGAGSKRRRREAPDGRRSTRGRRAAADRPRARRGCRASCARRVRPSSRCRSPTPRAQSTADRDGVVVFRDRETASISVLYRRADGELTLVEIEL